jgi:hypothetical protein
VDTRSAAPHRERFAGELAMGGIRESTGRAAAEAEGLRRRNRLPNVTEIQMQTWQSTLTPEG